MSAPEGGLTLQVHLEDGQTVKFVQSDPQAVRALIAHLQPTKLFAQHHLAIGGSRSLTTFPCARVVQVDFIGYDLPEWPHHHGVRTLKEITEAEFHERFRPESYGAVTPGQVMTAYAEIELMDGKHHFAEVVVEAQARLPQEQNIFLQQILSGGGIHITRREGGLMILNPIQVVRMSLYPGMAALPPNAWIAEKA